jgi:hypothetical protein
MAAGNPASCCFASSVQAAVSLLESHLHHLAATATRASHRKAPTRLQYDEAYLIFTLALRLRRIFALRRVNNFQ